MSQAKKKGLRPIRGITEEEALRDLKGPRPPPGVPQARWRGGNRGATGDALSWHRGWHAGIHDAFLTVNQRYPRVARQLREAFGMDEEGDIELR